MARGTRYRHPLKGAKVVKTDGTALQNSAQVVAGSAQITGSGDVVTGLTTIYAAFANIRGESGSTYISQAKFNKTANTVVGGLAAGSVRLRCLASIETTGAATESTDAASVDWMAIGT